MKSFMVLFIAVVVAVLFAIANPAAIAAPQGGLVVAFEELEKLAHFLHFKEEEKAKAKEEAAAAAAAQAAKEAEQKELKQLDKDFDLLKELEQLGEKEQEVK